MVFGCFKNVNLFILELISVCVTSCSFQTTEQQFQEYNQTPSNRHTQINQIGPVTITCSYRPIDLLVKQELSSISKPTAKMIDSLKHQFTGRTYCSLSFAHKGTELENRYLPDQQEFTQAITYLNTGIAQDVYLITSDRLPDSVTALTAMYPRQYGNTGRSTVLLVFDTRRLDLSHGFTLSYHDTHFGLGTLRFRFSADALAN